MRQPAAEELGSGHTLAINRTVLFEKASDIRQK
jgi:hypothetical protein